MVTNVSEENTFRILWRCRLYCFPNAGNTEPDYKDYSQDHNIKLRIIYFIQLLSLLTQIWPVLYTKHLCKVAFLKETLHFNSIVHWGVQYCTLADLTDKHTKENLHINSKVLQNMIQWCLPKKTTLYLCTNTETYWDLAFWSDTSVVRQKTANISGSCCFSHPGRSSTLSSEISAFLPDYKTTNCKTKQQQSQSLSKKPQISTHVWFSRLQ
jgi:hypothetical protein